MDCLQASLENPAYVALPMPYFPSLPADAGPPNVHANKRVERGYVNLYPAFREQE